MIFQFANCQKKTSNYQGGNISSLDQTIGFNAAMQPVPIMISLAGLQNSCVSSLELLKLPRCYGKFLLLRLPFMLWELQKIPPSFIWVNYNISLTRIKAIRGWFPLLTMISRARSQWGRYTQIHGVLRISQENRKTQTTRDFEGASRCRLSNSKASRGMAQMSYLDPACPPKKQHAAAMAIIFWLVVDLPLWKIWKSVGMIIPNIWENKQNSKPPTKYWLYCYVPWSKHATVLGNRPLCFAHGEGRPSSIFSVYHPTVDRHMYVFLADKIRW